MENETIIKIAFFHHRIIKRKKKANFYFILYISCDKISNSFHFYLC